MKSFAYTIILACSAALALGSCQSASEEPACPDEGALCYPGLSFSVSEMTVSPESRALYPMNPDEEKYVKTLAIFEFDKEGLHDQSERSYHFIDFVEGTVDGKTGVGIIQPAEFGISESSLQGIALQERSYGTLCLVGNVSRQQVVDLYSEFEKQGHAYGRLSLEYFKSWALPFEYITTTDETTTPDGTKVDGAYDETSSGHLKTMYMFGYYEGPINDQKPEDIRVDLGRLASRIDITIINETGYEIRERLGYHFDNVCNSAYFFPMKMSMPPTTGAGTTRTLICTGPEHLEDAVTPVPETFPAGAEHDRYFYAAAHAAENYTKATSLHLFWNSKVLGTDVVDKGGSDVRIPLCNIQPSEAASVPNGYSLSRNTRYHFTIHLTRVPSTPAATNTPAARSVADPERPGHYIVYLP